MPLAAIPDLGQRKKSLRAFGTTQDRGIVWVEFSNITGGFVLTKGFVSKWLTVTR